VEIAPRIPVQSGPFGIKANPNGRFIAVTARESGRIDFEGNTISIIDVERARLACPAPRRRVCASARTIPTGGASFTVAWTPDGRQIVVANYRSNNVSIVDLSLALAIAAGRSGTHRTRAAADADGQVRPARPKEPPSPLTDATPWSPEGRASSDRAAQRTVW